MGVTHALRFFYLFHFFIDVLLSEPYLVFLRYLCYLLSYQESEQWTH